MHICSWLQGTSQKLKQRQLQDQTLQKFLQRWCLCLWRSLPIYALGGEKRNVLVGLHEETLQKSWSSIHFSLGEGKPPKECTTNNVTFRRLPWGSIFWGSKGYRRGYKMNLSNSWSISSERDSLHSESSPRLDVNHFKLKINRNIFNYKFLTKVLKRWE